MRCRHGKFTGFCLACMKEVVSRVLPSSDPRAQRLCGHQQNPQACLLCHVETRKHVWAEQQEETPTPRYTQIVHLVCGCRLSVTPENEVLRWDGCQTGHPEMPRHPRWFWHAAIKAGMVGEQHGLEGRAECADERCQMASQAIDRARFKAQRWTPPKPGFGSDQ